MLTKTYAYTKQLTPYIQPKDYFNFQLLKTAKNKQQNDMDLANNQLPTKTKTDHKGEPMDIAVDGHKPMRTPEKKRNLTKA